MARRAALPLLCVPVLLSCAKPAALDMDKEFGELIDEICQRTQVGRYDDIAELIELSRRDFPTGYEAEQAYGEAAVAALKAVNELAYIVATGRNVIAGAFSAQADSDADLTSLIQPFFQDLENVALKLQNDLQKTIDEYPDGSLKLNECVIYFGEIPLLSLHGELDANDLRVWIAITSALRGVINIVIAQDLGIDVLGGLEVVSRLTTDPLCQPNILADKRCLLQLAAWLLDRYPRLLAVHPKEGGPAYLRAREASAKSFEMIVAFVDSVQQESDDQSDDYFVLEDVKRSSSGELESFTVAFQNYSYNPSDFEWFSQSFFENRTLVYRPSGEMFRTAIELSGSIVQDATTLRDHMQSGGDPVDAHAFLMPVAQIAGPMLEALLADQFRELIDSYDPDGSLREGLASTGISGSDLALLLIRSIMPRGFVYLDFYGFTANPAPLRSFLPNYDYVDPFDGRPTLAMEWECNYYETASQICHGDVALTDSDHFADYDYHFESDGLPSRFGYLALQDPTIGGFLFVDVAGAPQTTVTVDLPVRPDGPEHTAGAVMPDNYVYNYAIHRMGAYVIQLLEEVE